MMQGFNTPKVILNKDKLDDVIRQYKRAKRYMRSGIYEVRKLDNTETYISNLINEAKEDPPVL